MCATHQHERELTQVLEDELTRTVELLNCRLDVVEKELAVALDRAEVAEMELIELRRASRLALNPKDIDVFEYALSKKPPTSIPPPPPPPPPPLPPAQGSTIYLPKLKLKLALDKQTHGEDGTDDESRMPRTEATGEEILCVYRCYCPRPSSVIGNVPHFHTSTQANTSSRKDTSFVVSCNGCTLHHSGPLRTRVENESSVSDISS